MFVVCLFVDAHCSLDVVVDNNVLDTKFAQLAYADVDVPSCAISYTCEQGR